MKGRANNEVRKNEREKWRKRKIQKDEGKKKYIYMKRERNRTNKQGIKKDRAHENKS